MDGEGPQGAKGVGEAPAICIAAATANAIYNATGVRIYELPFTPEKVYRALHRVPARSRAGPRSMKRTRPCCRMEQALSLPYATLRFAQLGWRVIRIEATPAGDGLPGDPNRYIGARGRRRRPAQLLHRAQRRQGGDRAQPQGPARPGGAAAADRASSTSTCSAATPCRRATEPLGIDYATLSRGASPT